MDTLSSKFEKIQSDFIRSNASKKSIESIYDIIYTLKKINERNFEENYILACAYELVGKNILASKIIESTLINNFNEYEIGKLKNLEKHIESKDIWYNKKYRDLRDAQIVKKPTELNLSDFVISKDRNEFCIAISNKIEKIVIFNKNVKIEDLDDKKNIAFSENEPTNSLLLKLIDYIQWIGKVKDELVNFYNNSNFVEGKIFNVGKEWYDGLEVFDFFISIDNDENFETGIVLLDYLQNDYGFRLEIENRNIISIEYDANI